LGKNWALTGAVWSELGQKRQGKRIKRHNLGKIGAQSGQKLGKNGAQLGHNLLWI